MRIRNSKTVLLTMPQLMHADPAGYSTGSWPWGSGLMGCSAEPIS